MARIVLGVGASHSTLMNTHWDQTADRSGAERFRDGLAAGREAIVAAEPDAVVVIGSNHFRGMWLDLLPAFTLGIGDVNASGEGGTPSGPQRTCPELARAIATDLVEAGTEVAVSARLQVDHGQAHAIQWLLDGMEVPVVPLIVNVFAAPLPTVRRCMELGRNLSTSIDRHPSDMRIVIVASGGLSHRLPWPADWQEPANEDEEFMAEAWLNGRADWQRYDMHRREIITAAEPRLFPEFDTEFLSRLEEGGLETYADWTTEQLGKAAGNGGQEVRTWLTMAAALSFSPGRRLAYSPMPEWLTAMAAALIEPATT